jgi:uncharacterized protein YggE/uncharacterized membrane protein YeaQ/YmgE (transglycosylase-associated protein family)
MMEDYGILAWIVIGGIAGGIAKLLMPGKDPGGCIVTVLLGLPERFWPGSSAARSAGTTLATRARASSPRSSARSSFFSSTAWSRAAAAESDSAAVQQTANCPTANVAHVNVQRGSRTNETRPACRADARRNLASRRCRSAAGGDPCPARRRHPLEISATGEATRVPDIAIISAGVVTRAATAKAALQQNAAQMERVRAALRRAGIAERDIQTANINLNPEYRYVENQPPRLTGYSASNQLNVRFRDIAATGDILDALVAQGANQINGPSLTIDKPQEALDEARGKAIAVGRARAELMPARWECASFGCFLSASRAAPITGRARWR